MDSNDISRDWKVSFVELQENPADLYNILQPILASCSVVLVLVDCRITGHARSRRGQRCRRGIFGSSTGSAKPINRGVAAWFENAVEGKLFSVPREKMFEVDAYCVLIGLILIIYAPTFQQCVCCSFSRETFYCQVFSRGLSPMTSRFVVEVQTRKGSGLWALENIGKQIPSLPRGSPEGATCVSILSRLLRH